MRRVLSAILIAGSVVASYATDARVVTMGRTDAFFMDDMSIYGNPANISIYPNMLIGSYGVYRVDSTLDPTGQYSALSRRNRDPQRPFFGGILSYSLNQSAEAGDQYPMISMGLIVNRHDPLLDYLMPGNKTFAERSQPIIDKAIEDAGIPGPDVQLERPIGKFDVLLGYALPNGAMIGAGAYAAFQEKNISGGKTDEPEFESKLFKGNAGITWPIAKTMDLEISGGGGILTSIGQVIDTAEAQLDDGGTNTTASESKSERLVIADNDWSVRGEIRLFSALRTLNGDFVPHFEMEHLNLALGKAVFTNVAFGVGLNINIDRGFFWTGMEGLYEEAEINSNNTSAIGGRLGFGIERNVIWDWLIWRVAGNKKIMYRSLSEETGYWEENPIADASDEDLVSFGLGVNLENRLKVDVVVAEDVLYTFTNLISGNHHHLLTRISATYSF
jgi:hypothetical protein